MSVNIPFGDTVKEILNWIKEAMGKTKDKGAKFKFLSKNSIFVRCETDDDCPLDDYCAEKFCQEKSTVNAAERKRLKPSFSCPEETPCNEGSKCIKPMCNRYGALWGFSGS